MYFFDSKKFTKQSIEDKSTMLFNINSLNVSNYNINNKNINFSDDAFKLNKSNDTNQYFNNIFNFNTSFNVENNLETVKSNNYFNIKNLEIPRIESSNAKSFESSIEYSRYNYTEDNINYSIKINKERVFEFMSDSEDIDLNKFVDAKSQPNITFYKKITKNKNINSTNLLTLITDNIQPILTLYKCKYCNKKFKKSGALGGHISKRHPNEETQFKIKKRMDIISVKQKKNLKQFYANI